MLFKILSVVVIKISDTLPDTVEAYYDHKTANQRCKMWCDAGFKTNLYLVPVPDGD